MKPTERRNTEKDCEGLKGLQRNENTGILLKNEFWREDVFVSLPLRKMNVILIDGLKNTCFALAQWCGLEYNSMVLSGAYSNNFQQRILRKDHGLDRKARESYALYA